MELFTYLTGFTVYHSHIFLIFREPIIHVFAKRSNYFHTRRVMIIERVIGDSLMKLRNVVCPFGASESIKFALGGVVSIIV